MVDIGHGFFMVKFDIEEDRTKVIEGGSWMIFIISWLCRFGCLNLLPHLCILKKHRFGLGFLN